MNKPMTDKTQEELERKLKLVIYNAKHSLASGLDGEWTEIYEPSLLENLIDYINKYYVPKGDLEDPGVSNEAKLNQADKLSESIGNVCPTCHGEGYTSQYHSFPCHTCKGTGKTTTKANLDAKSKSIRREKR